MPDDHSFQATIVFNPRTEQCKAPNWDEAEKILKKRCKPGEVIYSMTNKTLCSGGGVITG